MSESTFPQRFLSIFVPEFYKQERILDRLHEYFDPEVCPSGFLDYLASWIDLDLDRNWSEEKRRKLILNAMELYKKRGLPEGIATFVEIYTGHRPKILEHWNNGMKIGVRSTIGVNTKIYRGARDEVFKFTVFLEVDDATKFDHNEVRRIVDIQKPSWAKYYLVIKSNCFMQIGVRSTIGVDTTLGD